MDELEHLKLVVLAVLPAQAVWFLGVWITFLGASVGSFMNVVIYRLPARKSLVHPGSHCPRCNHPIRWHDNLPVFGWLMLRGKCRDCRGAISIRYPCVEALVAGVFLLLFITDLVLTQMPSDDVPDVTGRAAWGTFGLHALLMCVLICTSMMEYDGSAAPWKLFLPASLTVFVLSAFFPDAWPFPLWNGWSAGPGRPPLLLGLSTSFAGFAGGGMAVAVAWPVLARGPAGKSGRPCAMGAGKLLGGCLGWQAALPIIATVSLIYMFISALGRFWLPVRRIPWTGVLTIVAFVWLIAWKHTIPVLRGMGADAGWTTIVNSMILVLFSSLITWVILQPKKTAKRS